jgi:hypothetical protein
MTKLPPPAQWVLHALNEMEVAELIEEYIDYVDEDGRSVHLPTNFVRHYVQRYDSPLPTVVAIATQPIVLADGGLIAASDGMDTLRGIALRVPKEIMALVPRREDCTRAAVAKAMRFLINEWLVDVQTDSAGKCVTIAAALTIIQRSLLDQRPVFFVTAGQRGSGKTTLLTMLLIAVTGLWPAAAAWSPSAEERRKAVMAYFLEGVAYILWDNIPRGMQISCPHIERSCTSAFYSDRKLGFSETICTAASTIHFFTGNNIGPRGDLASRQLSIQLDTDRPDPENRDYKHPDPIHWTETHRAEILAAFYTILLGNPSLDLPREETAKTRFKMWYRMVGSAVENAAAAINQKVDFRQLFGEADEEDEDAASVASMLAILSGRFADRKFASREVADLINRDTNFGGDGDVLRDFLFPMMKDRDAAVSSDKVGRQLRKYRGQPTNCEDRVLILRGKRDPSGPTKDPLMFWIEGAASPTPAPDHLVKAGGAGKSKDRRDNQLSKRRKQRN